MNFNAIYPANPIEKKCKDEFDIRKEDNDGDYYLVDQGALIDTSTWLNSTDFPTLALEYSTILIDGLAAPVI